MDIRLNRVEPAVILTVAGTRVLPSRIAPAPLQLLSILAWLIGAWTSQDALADPAPEVPQTSARGASQAAPQELPEVTVVGSSPIGAAGIPIELYPGNVQTISTKGAVPGTNTVSDELAATVGSVNLNDTQGNPYQIDVNYRGYTASPVLGTPQGLSVYVDGIRVNEPFGNVVSWDLIPQIAISTITVIPGTNPVYGLNTLGGALAINTKSGFAFPGTSATVETGSFDRRSLQTEYGGHESNTDFYVAGSFYDENGWAKSNPSLVRQFFSKIGFQDDDLDLDLSIQYVDDFLGGNQLVAHSMIEDAVQGYSHPDIANTRSFVTNLAGRAEIGNGRSLEGNVYYRNIWRSILDSNINDPVVAGSTDQAAFCAAAYGEACAGNVVSTYTQQIFGTNIQFSSQAPVLGHVQYISVGANAESGRTSFSQAGQDARIDASFATIGDAAFTPQSRITAQNTTLGLYATDTVVINTRASVTASGRYDHARVELAGNSIDADNAYVNVNGTHLYQRFNPALGGTFLLVPEVTLFANYAEGSRTPSAIELACADPVHPCAGVPSAFSSDPALKAVVARSVEFGARGRLDDTLTWRAAAFYSNLSDDILFNQSSLTTGFFSNVGGTRREGVELTLDGKASAFDFATNLTYLNATYRTAFYVADPANAGSVCPGPSCIPVHPGDRIPGLPALIAKLQLGYAVSAATRLDALLLAQSSTFARGDENNLATYGRIPGYATVRVGFTHQFSPSMQIYGGISNVFNRLYANFGMVSNNDLKNGVPENFWAVGQPRTFFLAFRAALS